MGKFDDLRAELEQFRQQNQNELDFRPIQKWMTRELGVEHVGSKGSHSIYHHRLLKDNLNEDGNFHVALKKGSKKPIIYRKNFIEYLYPRCKEVIDLLEKEEYDV